MEDTNKQRPRRRFFRFSLFTLLLAFTCIAGYFSGWRWGAQQRQQDISDTTFSTQNYHVGDLVTPLSSKTGASLVDFDPLVDLIVSTIDPDSWMENGTGEGEIQTFPSNSSITVSCTGKTHDEIADLLQSLRNLRYELPKDYLDRVREAVARKQNHPILIKVLTQYSVEDIRRMENHFESAVNHLMQEYGKPSGVYQAGEKGFPEWATAQRIAVWDHWGGKFYFALQDCRPQGKSLVAGWWEKSFGALQPIQLAPQSLVQVE